MLRSAVMEFLRWNFVERFYFFFFFLFFFPCRVSFAMYVCWICNCNFDRNFCWFSIWTRSLNYNLCGCLFLLHQCIWFQLLHWIGCINIQMDNTLVIDINYSFFFEALKFAVFVGTNCRRYHHRRRFNE